MSKDGSFFVHTIDLEMPTKPAAPPAAPGKLVSTATRPSQRTTPLNQCVAINTLGTTEEF